MSITTRTLAIAAGAITLGAAGASAQTTLFNFEGLAGAGLLPGNQPGMTPPETDAIGGEIGDGIVFDSFTNTLDFAFEFSGLTGGLADVASGIHFHLAPEMGDPQAQNGGIIFNLNSGSDINVNLDTPLIPTDGTATSGTVRGTASLDTDQIDALFSGRFYLNVHSAEFTSGEIRGNLVVVPAPAGLAATGLLGLVAARRRRS